MELANTKMGSMSFCTNVWLWDWVVWYTKWKGMKSLFIKWLQITQFRTPIQGKTLGFCTIWTQNFILNNFYKRQKPVGVISTELANIKVGSMSFCTYVLLWDRVVWYIKLKGMKSWFIKWLQLTWLTQFRTKWRQVWPHGQQRYGERRSR